MVRIIVILLAVVGGLVLVCFGGMFVASLWLLSNTGPPEGIAVHVQQPDTIREGDTFDIVVTIDNALTHERTLRDIDFWDPLMSGVHFVGVTPEYESFDPSFGFGTFTMNTPIPASGSSAVTFTFTAMTPGTYTADLDVSVDHILRIDTTVHTIEIVPRDR